MIHKKSYEGLWFKFMEAHEHFVEGFSSVVLQRWMLSNKLNKVKSITENVYIIHCIIYIIKILYITVNVYTYKTRLKISIYMNEA